MLLEEMPTVHELNETLVEEFESLGGGSYEIPESHIQEAMAESVDLGAYPNDFGGTTAVLAARIAGQLYTYEVEYNEGGGIDDGGEPFILQQCSIEPASAFRVVIS